MADTSNLTNFLEDIADAIRTKKSTTEEIPAANFDTEILSIETGIDTSDATATVNDMTEGKTAYVNGEKITGTIPEITPYTGVLTLNQKGIGSDGDGTIGYLNSDMDKDTIVRKGTNVAIMADNAKIADMIGLTADKIVKGNSFLGIEGTAEAGGTAIEGVKLFETQEEMQADESAKEGDLAVVYREEIKNMTADSQTQYITFPETVTLPGAFESSAYITLRAIDSSAMFDGNIQLSKTSFRFDGYSESGMIRVQYSSSNGITYTRTRFSGNSGDLTNPVDLGTTVKYEPMEPWNDALGYFMQIGGMKFDGLYKYTLNVPINSFKLREQSSANYNLTYTQSNPGLDKIYTGEEVFTGEDVGNKIREILKNEISGAMFLSKDMSILYLVPTGFQTLYVYNNKLEPLVFNSADKAADIVYYKYTLSDMQHEEITMTKSELGIVDNGVVTNLPDDSYYMLGIVNSSDTNIQWKVSNSSYYQSYVVGTGTEIEYDDRYIIADTQFNAQAHELLPGKIAYGKNGVIIGDDSIYDNLDLDKILITYFGVDSAELKFSPSTVFNNSDTYIDGTKLALTINIPNGSGLYLEDGVPYHLTGMLTSTTNVATLVKKSTSSTTDKLSSSGTLLSRYDKIHRYMIDASYISSTDCIIQIFDENGTRIHNFSIPKTNISSYTYFAYYDNVLIYSTSGKGLFKYDIFNQTETQLYSDANGVPLYDHITNKVYIATSGTLYEYDITTKTRVTINTGIDLASACEKCIVYYASDTIYVKEIGDTTWLSQTGAVCSTTASSGTGRGALVFYSQNMDKVYSMLIAKSGYYKDKTNVCEISLTDGTIRIINTNLSVDIGSIDKSSANTFDGEHVYIFDTWDIFEYIISTDTITKIGLPDIISTGSNSMRYLFADFTKANEFKIMIYNSSGYANISRSVKTVQGILSNFESGIDTTKLNFISNNKGNRCFIIGGNPIIDYNVNGTITPKEYDTALNTANEILGEEVNE